MREPGRGVEQTSRTFQLRPKGMLRAGLRHAQRVVQLPMHVLAFAAFRGTVWVVHHRHAPWVRQPIMGIVGRTGEPASERHVAFLRPSKGQCTPLVCRSLLEGGCRGRHDLHTTPVFPSPGGPLHGPGCKSGMEPLAPPRLVPTSPTPPAHPPPPAGSATSKSEPRTCAAGRVGQPARGPQLLEPSNHEFFLVSVVRQMRRPGIEPGSPPWQGGILPLYYRRLSHWKHASQRTVGRLAVWSAFVRRGREEGPGGDREGGRGGSREVSRCWRRSRKGKGRWCCSRRGTWKVHFMGYHRAFDKKLIRI